MSAPGNRIVVQRDTKTIEFRRGKVTQIRGWSRRFEVRLRADLRGIDFNASNDSTKKWAESNAALFSIIIATVAEECKDAKVVTDREYNLAVQNVETCATIAARFKAKLDIAFPEETFDVSS